MLKNLFWVLLGAGFALGVFLLSLQTSGREHAKEPKKVPDNPKLQVATLGGGCFWCIEAVFLELEGVEQVVSGYSGGTTENPTYEQVCEGNTGHAEVVQVYFDPEKVSYAEILDVFFHVHDPTTLNRQGNDAGTQYRSVIFYHDDAQKRAAGEVMARITAEKLWNGALVTKVELFTRFYAAEDYHQNYFAENPRQPYCSMVIAPKVQKFRAKYYDRLKKSPTH